MGHACAWIFPTSPGLNDVRLFRNGRSRALHIRREFGLAGNEAILGK